MKGPRYGGDFEGMSVSAGCACDWAPKHLHSKSTFTNSEWPEGDAFVITCPGRGLQRHIA